MTTLEKVGYALLLVGAVVIATMVYRALDAIDSITAVL